MAGNQMVILVLCPILVLPLGYGTANELRMQVPVAD
jgi:hypothetical protein